jgi:hypothetical protein
MPERRTSPRQARSLEGRIGYAGKYRLRCLILNISGQGAKLALERRADLPAEFLLTISKQGAQRDYWVRTTWQRGTVLGVTLTAMPPGSAPTRGIRRRRGVYQA